MLQKLIKSRKDFDRGIIKIKKIIHLLQKNLEKFLIEIKIFLIIDPIDGTTNFLHGVPHFAISIALQIEGEIIIGIIFDPVKNEIFFAEKNNGSFFNNNRVRVSNKNSLDDCLFSSNCEGIKSIYLN